MRFTKLFWDGIADGSITLAFRPWKRPTVVVGRPYRTGGGRVEVLSVNIVDGASISEDEARRAGHTSATELREWFAAIDDERDLYRVEFRLATEEDPRELLASSSLLTDQDLAEIDRRLDRLDAAAGHGPWTRATLALIAANPAVRAPDLANSMGRETQPFKLDVRKLKNLGLTHSLKIGYRPSPRGAAYLAARAAADSTAH